MALPLSCGQSALPALGTPGDVGVVSTFPTGDKRYELVRALLEREVTTVRGERAFRCQRIGEGERLDWKSHLILLDLSEPQDGRRIGSLFSAVERKQLADAPAAHRFFQDVWVRGQIVLVVHARDPQSLQLYLDENGEEIYSDLNDFLIDRLTVGLFAGGEEKKLEEVLAIEHPFHLRIPVGYSLDCGEDAAEIRRLVPEEPKRWFLVHYGELEKAPTRPEQWLALRDAVVGKRRRGDRILGDRSRVETGRFQDRSCVILEGIWQNETYAMGGPFRSYGFIRGGRYFLIDMAVFHPPAGKLPALRQLMAVARTFEV